eukprot:CAMPEP_0197440934 /NCGR_PEP_ID=MMETSP1175-20131217/7313_1 /TAXON_ID=1003142 /ORGANISM="Triceratium dubium, Strain CCMP147" /LENGTH=323 /DNA_ID=CAMNT_0042971125 /DNA_START=46 /DNA_END=1017 /DNA_ORIENTATION=-
MAEISYEVLSHQDATTSNAIIARFATSSDFALLSEREGSAILARDDEDAEKLQKGIDYAKEKGVIDPDFVPEEYISIDVLGKSPTEVAEVILGKINEGKGAAGSVVVLCGLSGTGKGTTVSTLKKMLECDGSGREVVTWSNGNIFRSVTLLAAIWCEQQADCDGFDKDRALTKENLASFMGMLEFGKFKDGKYDTRILGLGVDLFVSEVQNTELKAPKVSKNIPTVAEVTQGEVILFAAEAVKKMGEDGMVVLLEGREQTVNYVRTPLRFMLTLSDGSLIGKRRAAQRMMAAALEDVKEGAQHEEINLALEKQLKKMVSEVGK